MINTIGGKNEKSGFCSLLLGESAIGWILGAREERKERDNKKKERCTESEEHERVMEQREGLGKEKCRARETRQHLLTEMSPYSVLPGMNGSLSKAKMNSSVLVPVADVPWDFSKSLLPAVSDRKSVV